MTGARLPHQAVARFSEPLLHRPLVPAAAAFMGGILFAGTHGAVAVLWVTAAAAAGRAAVPHAGKRLWLALALLLALAGAGAQREAASTVPAYDDVSRLAGSGTVTLQGTVAGDALQRGGRWRVEIAVDRAQTADGRTVACSGIVTTSLPVRQGEPPEYGDGIDVIGIVATPREATNPGAYDYRAALARRGIYAEIDSRRVEWRLDPDAAETGVWAVVPRMASRCRRSLQNRLTALLATSDEALARGILIGDRSALDPATEDDFSASGTAHVMATAGLHVGIVAAMVLWACRTLRLSRRTAAGVAILVVAFYAMVAGGRPAVVRAAIMADVFLLAYLLDREPDAVSALAAAALLILAFRPADVFDPGFQLSFATVAVIIILLRPAQPWVERLRPSLSSPIPRTARIIRTAAAVAAALLLLSSAAQIGSAPLVARDFDQVSLVGVFANLFVVAALGPLIAVGFIAWAASFVCPPVAHLCAAYIVHPLLSFVGVTVHLAAHLPYAAINVPPPSWPAIAMYYAAVAAVAAVLTRRTGPTRAPSAAPVDADGGDETATAALAGPQ